jgi:beta-fructofuranosidase
LDTRLLVPFLMKFLVPCSPLMKFLMVALTFMPLASSVPFLRPDAAINQVHAVGARAAARARNQSGSCLGVPVPDTAVTVRSCTNGLGDTNLWQMPKPDGGHIVLAANPSLCLDIECSAALSVCVGGPDADGIMWWGPQAKISPCSAVDVAVFQLFSNGSIGVSKPKVQAGLCLATMLVYDLEFGGRAVQASPCGVIPENQHWNVTTSPVRAGGGDAVGNLTLIMAGGTAAGFCATACKDPPQDPNSFCPRYHPINDGGVYDPSGPLLDDSGTWHLFEDEGGWSHWTSEDLVHWQGSLNENTTHFSTNTGSVSPTASGVYAHWPIVESVKGKGCCRMIESAKATDMSLFNWEQRGATIPMPARIDAGFRDPTRAFQYPPTDSRGSNDGLSKWYVGVGCGSNARGAQFCLFEADDDTLMNFTDRGSLFTTNTTFGSVNQTSIVWTPNNVSANMIECPDLFPLADSADGGNISTWVLLGSLYKTNQWWVGTMSGDPPRFTPQRVGILDYGQGYAAKTGSTIVQGPRSRRVMFSFTGWQSPTNAPGCGRTMVLPRELGVRDGALTIAPVEEASLLRVAGSAVSNHVRSGSQQRQADGSQVELRLTCDGMRQALAAGTGGTVGVRTLGFFGPDNYELVQYTEVGYNLAEQALYVDHSRCCAAPSPTPIVQRASLPAASLAGSGDVLNLTVFVDGGLIEAFASERVAITALVSPDERAAKPGERRTEAFSSAKGVECAASSWGMAFGESVRERNTATATPPTAGQNGGRN